MYKRKETFRSHETLIILLCLYSYTYELQSIIFKNITITHLFKMGFLVSLSNCYYIALLHNYIFRFIPTKGHKLSDRLQNWSKQKVVSWQSRPKYQEMLELSICEPGCWLAQKWHCGSQKKSPLPGETCFKSYIEERKILDT